MHICFLTHEYPKSGYPHGGVGTFVQTLGRSLLHMGHFVSVVGIGYLNIDENENDEGVFVYRLSTIKIKGLSWYLNSRKINKKIAEIHTKTPITIIEATELDLAYIRKVKEIKYVIRMHGGHHFFADAENRRINWWKGYQEKRSIAKADRIIGVSNYVLDHTAKYLNFIDKRGPTIYNPVDMRRFYYADPHKAIRGRILFVGTVCEKKGVRQLIMALPLIRKDVPEAHLVIAGRDWKFSDGSSYISWVQQFINDCDRESITFLGPVENNQIPKLIESSEVCVYPSLMESFGIAWLEVLSMGSRLIASNVGPAKEIIKDGETGLLCDPLNFKDIADKTIKIIKNPSIGLKIGSAARVDVAERFSIKKIVEQNIEFYQSLINL